MKTIVSDQPAHLYILTRVFPVSTKNKLYEFDKVQSENSSSPDDAYNLSVSTQNAFLKFIHCSAVNQDLATGIANNALASSIYAMIQL